MQNPVHVELWTEPPCTAGRAVGAGAKRHGGTGFPGAENLRLASNGHGKGANVLVLLPAHVERVVARRAGDCAARREGDHLLAARIPAGAGAALVEERARHHVGDHGAQRVGAAHVQAVGGVVERHDVRARKGDAREPAYIGGLRSAAKVCRVWAQHQPIAALVAPGGDGAAGQRQSGSVGAVEPREARLPEYDGARLSGQRRRRRCGRRRRRGRRRQRRLRRGVLVRGQGEAAKSNRVCARKRVRLDNKADGCWRGGKGEVAHPDVAALVKLLKVTVCGFVGTVVIHAHGEPVGVQAGRHSRVYGG